LDQIGGFRSEFGPTRSMLRPIARQPKNMPIVVEEVEMCDPGEVIVLDRSLLYIVVWTLFYFHYMYYLISHELFIFCGT